MAAARKIELLPVREIEIGANRLRPLDRARVEGLKATLADPACPPLLPIEVCRKPGQTQWTLLDGLHRLTATREIGLDRIEALVHDNSTLTARMVELQRNLFVGELAPYERAKHIAELYYLELAKRGLDPSDDPRRLGGRPSKALKEAEKETSDIMSKVSLSGAVGASLSMQERHVRRYLTLYRILSPEVADKIERFRLNLPAAQLMLLAKQHPSDQQEIVERLLIPADHPDAAVLAWRITTVSAGVSKRAKDPSSKAYSQFKAAFGRMTLAEKKGVLDGFGSQLPAGYRLLTPKEAEALETIEAAIAEAFDVMTKLFGGEEPVEDDDLQEQAQSLQTALLLLRGRIMGGRHGRA